MTELELLTAGRKLQSSCCEATRIRRRRWSARLGPSALYCLYICKVESLIRLRSASSSALSSALAPNGYCFPECSAWPCGALRLKPKDASARVDGFCPLFSVSHSHELVCRRPGSSGQL